MILPVETGGVNYAVGLNQKIGDGKRAELIAASWLMEQGCYAFMPVTEQSPIDLIALAPNGEFFYFDVKKVARRKKDNTVISRQLSPDQLKLGVRLLYVDLETHEIQLYPHQFSRNNLKRPNVTARVSDSDLTISALLHRESSLKDQSCSEEP